MRSPTNKLEYFKPINMLFIYFALFPFHGLNFVCLLLKHHDCKIKEVYLGGNYSVMYKCIKSTCYPS